MKTRVSPWDVSDALEESPKFVGKTVCQTVLVFGHLHQVSIFEDISCVIIDDGANEVNGGVRGWGDCFQEDVFSCKCISAMKQRWLRAK
jgi:hypothetical protein